MRGTYCTKGRYIVDRGYSLYKGALFCRHAREHLLYKGILTVDKGLLMVNKGHLQYYKEEGTYRIFLCENKIVPLN